MSKLKARKQDRENRRILRQVHRAGTPGHCQVCGRRSGRSMVCSPACGRRAAREL